MRKQIILAVANGCTNTRQIAQYLNRPLSTINNYFYDSNNGHDTIDGLINGNILQWQKGKVNTMRLAKNVIKIRRKSTGKVVDVGRLEMR